MTRRVNKIIPSQRALDDENRVWAILLKQASERHIGTGRRGWYDGSSCYRARV
jgi:hypothetical protein